MVLFRKIVQTFQSSAFYEDSSSPILLEECYLDSRGLICPHGHGKWGDRALWGFGFSLGVGQCSLSLLITGALMESPAEVWGYWNLRSRLLVWPEHGDSPLTEVAPPYLGGIAALSSFNSDAPYFSSPPSRPSGSRLYLTLQFLNLL